MNCPTAATHPRVMSISRSLVLACVSGFLKLIRTFSTLRFTRKATSLDSSQQPSLYDNIPTRQAVPTVMYGKRWVDISEPSAFRTAVRELASSDWEAKPQPSPEPSLKLSPISPQQQQAMAQLSQPPQPSASKSRGVKKACH